MCTWCHATHWENKIKSTWICDCLFESLLTHDLSKSLQFLVTSSNPTIVKRTQNRKKSAPVHMNSMDTRRWQWLVIGENRCWKIVGPSSIWKRVLDHGSVIPNLLTCRSCCRPWFAECSWHIWGWTAGWSLGFEPKHCNLSNKIRTQVTNLRSPETEKKLGFSAIYFMLCRWSLFRHTLLASCQMLNSKCTW